MWDEQGYAQARAVFASAAQSQWCIFLDGLATVNSYVITSFRL